MARNEIFTAESIIEICSEYMNERSVAFVKKALDFATAAHAHQSRLSGEPYICLLYTSDAADDAPRV